MRRRSSGGVRRPLAARSQPISNFIPSVTAEAKVRKSIRGWVYEGVEPDIYAVCTVHQGIWHDNGTHRTYQSGDPIVYEDLSASFRHRLSKAVYGKCYERYRKKPNPKLIQMSGTLEGDGSGRHYHLNYFLKRPDWWTFEDFETLFKSIWSKYDWAHTNPKHAVKFRQRTGDCVGYGLKEGSDTLLVF